jgi:hypothetical protein
VLVKAFEEMLFKRVPDVVYVGSTVCHFLNVTKSYYQKNNPRKSYIWAKADWEQVNQDLDTLTPNIQEMANSRSNINDIWNTLKQHLFKCLDKHIPWVKIRSSRLFSLAGSSWS